MDPMGFKNGKLPFEFWMMIDPPQKQKQKTVKIVDQKIKWPRTSRAKEKKLKQMQLGEDVAPFICRKRTLFIRHGPGWDFINRLSVSQM